MKKKPANRISSMLVRVQGKLIGLYPREYQHKYAEERQDVFRMAVEDMRQSGWQRQLRFAWRELVDLLLTASYETWQERKKKMATQMIDLQNETQGKRLYLYYLPFMISILSTAFNILLPDGTGLGAVLAAILLASLVIGLLVTIGVGVRHQMPGWAVPSLGVLIGMLNLGFIIVWVPVVSPLLQFSEPNAAGTEGGYAILKFAASQIFGGFLVWLPGLLLIYGVFLLSARAALLKPLADRMRQDWTILCLLVYCSFIFGPVIGFSDYASAAPYQLTSYLFYALGAVLFLRSQQPWQRAAALAAGVILMQLTVGAGIFAIYPLQEAQFNFYPRWREALGPVFAAAGMAVILAVPAFISMIRPGSKTSSIPG